MSLSGTDAEVRMWRGEAGASMMLHALSAALITTVYTEINVTLSVSQISRVQSGLSTRSGAHAGSD